MTASPVIRAVNLCKRFTLHTSGATTLKEMIVSGAFARASKTTYNALDGISFELQRGRSLAIAGSNGSGKSTLLKLISGISQPTSGTLEVHGRIAALLELGAGFQPELTGMENVFLQGSLLGLSRDEILERLPDVLDFCELGPFIHTPMKRYSSGMTVRLGFALAVFSDAETLLIDEVLSVGDSAFQAKCLRKIAALRAEGRTILFVSHFVPQIEHVAEEMLWIEKGKMIAYGPIGEVLPDYVDSLMGKGGAEENTYEPATLMEEVDWSDERRNFVMASSPRGVRHGGTRATIEDVAFFDHEGRRTPGLEAGRACAIEVTFTAHEKLDVQVEFGYAGLGDLRMGWQGTELQGMALRGVEGRMTVRASIAALPFHPGRYQVGVALSNPNKKQDYYDLHYEAYSIQVRGRKDPEDVSITRPPGRFVAGISS
ncbi:MAG: lipopolysaccharide transport system ATP-binding protein [Candidatus Sumerlaeota bacterium]|nr:lipopolysaccharide transport system ATP-binding protein [Candidatus Sumerlaeota bacterium]